MRQIETSPSAELLLCRAMFTVDVTSGLMEIRFADTLSIEDTVACRSRIAESFGTS